MDLVEGAAIFSAGGGGDPQMGRDIVNRLIEERCPVHIIDPLEVPDNVIVVNFACVGATDSIAYHSEAAVKTLENLEEHLDRKAFGVIPAELGGFNTLAAVDVAARSGVPIVDGDGAGRAVPEVHLKVYTIDNIPLAPMIVADHKTRNVVLVKQTEESRAAEQIVRALASEWNQTAYTARRVLKGTEVKTSPIMNTLSASMRIGMVLRKAVDRQRAMMMETEAFRLFEGVVSGVQRETSKGFTWTRILIDGQGEHVGSTFELKARNEVLAAYRDGRLTGMAPDIITPIDPETCSCVVADKIGKGDRLTVIGIRAPNKWRTHKGLELWGDVLKRSNINEKYVPIEQLSR